MKNIYFKILCGYDSERTVPIELDELEKAYALFLARPDARGIFRAGAVTSREMQLIVPDLHRMLGWNSNYKLTADDNADSRVRAALNTARDEQNRHYERVQYLIRSNRADEIGKGVPIPEIDEPALLLTLKGKQIKNILKKAK